MGPNNERMAQGRRHGFFQISARGFGHAVLRISGHSTGGEPGNPSPASRIRCLRGSKPPRSPRSERKARAILCSRCTSCAISWKPLWTHTGSNRTHRTRLQVAFVIGQMRALIDLSQVPSASRRETGSQTALYLLDILGRVKAIDAAVLPGPDDLDDQSTIGFRLPGTPLRIVEITRR